VLAWLLGAALGPAAVALPVNWAADALAGAAQRWFKRLRRADDLSRLVRAATGTSVDLTHAEFDAVRKLLEDQQTWTMLGRGTVEDLAGRIADCLPPRDGRTAEDSHAAALTITRGLIEFAVADLDPKLFQQVLMARLQRMETDQASALDKAMFDLHDDLTAGFASVMDQFKLVLDRLPPGPAGRGEIAVYLRTLIDWLNTDPWWDLGGSVPTPAAIECKLRVTATGRAHEHDLDADALAWQCRRLVILGGPGSGKTWLARRTARRCAEDALHGLAAGGTLDEVELPLYTTCSALFSAEGYIRDAVVSSAFAQLPDLGGSRISAALRQSFTERNTATVLIVDSLDEAHGPSDRLRQLDHFPWRVVLTSRRSSWRHQLTINDTDESHRVGDLQPLNYPWDVEPFIWRWFDGRPEGNDLAAQVAGRPDLQQAATVPLILAFYLLHRRRQRIVAGVPPRAVYQSAQPHAPRALAR
jgi:NACHT domain